MQHKAPPTVIEGFLSRPSYQKYEMATDYATDKVIVQSKETQLRAAQVFRVHPNFVDFLFCF